MPPHRPEEITERTRVPLAWVVASIAFAATGAWATAGIVWRMDKRLSRVEIRTTLVMQHLKIKDPTQSESEGLIFNDAEAGTK
jgi:hypothetical protein